jgi:4-hydroxybenzoate polyprenyltransferase
MHLFVYPSSNAYNSYIDQDDGSIGGLKNPPKATRQLYYLSLVMDAIAILAVLIINLYVALMIAGYILASRAYSSKQIRLKKYAIISYLVVVVFQGAYIYILAQLAAGCFNMAANNYGMYASSFLIGGIYPLTQIYQHKEDAANGDQTISLKLGIKGTFTLSTAMFGIAALLMFMHFFTSGKLVHFYLYLLFQAPPTAFFMWWRKHAIQYPELANFKNTMLMNILAACCMNILFVLLIFLNLL